MTMRPLHLAITFVVVSSLCARAAPVVPWQDAGSHTSGRVTIEGHVATAATADRRCVLTFDPADPEALRIILLVPLITDLPAAPDRLYSGRRIRATGRVHRFGGHLEMIVRSPDQIEVLGMTAEEPAPALAVEEAPSTAAPAPAGPIPPPKPAAPSPAAPVPPPVAPAPSAPEPVADTPPSREQLACQRTTDALRHVRADARRLTTELHECLASRRPRCAAIGDRLGPALTELERSEQQRESICPPGSSQ